MVSWSEGDSLKALREGGKWNPAQFIVRLIFPLLPLLDFFFVVVLVKHMFPYLGFFSSLVC